ncbi:MAG TPA: twin-arginine translocation signal domain-containing protein [Candidatus Angelobacter sp.]|jgi:hypothetical protein
MKDEKAGTSSHENIPSSNGKSSAGKNGAIQASRRGFLKTAGLGAAVITAGAILPTSLIPEAEAVEIGPPSQNPSLRASQSDQVRKTTSGNESAAIKAAFPHQTNGDEETYANQAFAGSFSKTLNHNASTGLVVPSDYHALVSALTAGTKAALDGVPAGGPGKLAGPLSPLAFQLQGVDSTAAAELFVPPSISTAAAAAVYVELYWEAFLRDVPFIDYGSNSLVAQAVTDMNKLSAYSGPKPVTPQNIFRYPFFGATDGPIISQILYTTHSLDGVNFVPMINTRFPVADKNTGTVLTGPNTGLDFMTNLNEYVFVQNGNGALDNTNPADPTPRFIRSGRDIGSYVNSDSIFSTYFRTAIMLQNLGVPVDPNNPYANDHRISGFNTFSTAWLFNLIGAGQDTEAQAFYQKWYVHRHLRPEAFGNLVDGIKTNRFTLSPSLHSDLLNSAVLPLIFQRNKELNTKRNMGTNGSFFLPQESNGGSPSHPDSASGHAFTAGCSVTLLKAVFDVGTPTNPRPWPLQPVEASEDGLTLLNNSTPLTILGELNKLAMNIADGRDWLGIHSRIGGNMLGLTLGEDTAIHLLTDLGFTYPEPTFAGFTLTKFDGTTVTVGAKQTVGTTKNTTTCPA